MGSLCIEDWSKAYPSCPAASTSSSSASSFCSMSADAGSEDADEKSLQGHLCIETCSMWWNRAHPQLSGSFSLGFQRLYLLLHARKR